MISKLFKFIVHLKTIKITTDLFEFQNFSSLQFIEENGNDEE